MGMIFQVKTRLALGIVLLAGGYAKGESTTPNAHEILRSVRFAQSGQDRTLRGRLRSGANVSPFLLVIAGTTIRYEFADPPQTIQLRLLENDSRLEEITRDGAERVTPARFDHKLRQSDIAYEDLAMKFLYWPNAAVEGEQTMLLRKCWIIRAEPGGRKDSQYSRVMLWVEKESGALMQAEAFRPDGALAKRFKVVSGQKADGIWILKQMRIETIGGERGRDRTPTYLEIQGVEKS